MAARQAASHQCSRPSRVPAGRNPSAAFAFLFVPPRLTFSIDARYETSQDNAEVVRAVLARREIGVGTSAAAETAVITAMHPSYCGRAARNPTPTRASTRPVDADVVPRHGDVIVSEGPGDEISAVRT